MRIVVTHALVLLAALAVAYQTWSREDDATSSPGTVSLWDREPEDLTRIVYQTSGRRVSVERREDDTGAFVWVSVTIDRDTTTAAPDSVIEFPGDDQAHDLIEAYAAPRAIRGLGAIDTQSQEEFGLIENTATLRIELGDDAHILRVGGIVFASGDRYVQDPESGRAYILPARMVSSLHSAEGVLVERAVHPPPILERVAHVTVRTNGDKRTIRRVAGATANSATWDLPEEPGRPNQTFATFMERVERLSVMNYVPNLNLDDLDFLASIEYSDEDGFPVDRLELYRSSQGDEPVYYVATDYTRVPGRVYSGLAEPLDEDLSQLF
ncbi:MAG: hypothetical protein OXI46_02900 [Gemmatimonadota bacterium]|nr:hypothetical protein [Gemmatimonadota bacterium]